MAVFQLNDDSYPDLFCQIYQQPPAELAARIWEKTEERRKRAFIWDVPEPGKLAAFCGLMAHAHELFIFSHTCFGILAACFTRRLKPELIEHPASVECLANSGEIHFLSCQDVLGLQFNMAKLFLENQSLEHLFGLIPGHWFKARKFAENCGFYHSHTYKKIIRLPKGRLLDGHVYRWDLSPLGDRSPLGAGLNKTRISNAGYFCKQF